MSFLWTKYANVLRNIDTTQTVKYHFILMRLACQPKLAYLYHTLQKDTSNTVTIWFPGNFVSRVLGLAGIRGKV